MPNQDIHFMTAELIVDRRTVRYTCPVCDRCLEDGPDGLILIHRGDQAARHRGGSIQMLDADAVQLASGPPAVH